MYKHWQQVALFLNITSHLLPTRFWMQPSILIGSTTKESVLPSEK
ncbi:hypothetical protein PB1E_0658 [Leuconostoc gelidum subsp. gasicomitatum]|nr:hypothetical protein PB1E_0658 [Leuconostoc gasicomitatum]